jgi:hypothetical protein
MSKETRVINTIPQAIYYACNEYPAGDGKVPAPKAGYLYIVTKDQEAQHPDRDDLIGVAPPVVILLEANEEQQALYIEVKGEAVKLSGLLLVAMRKNADFAEAALGATKAYLLENAEKFPKVAEMVEAARKAKEN